MALQLGQDVLDGCNKLALLKPALCSKSIPAQVLTVGLAARSVQQKKTEESREAYSNCCSWSFSEMRGNLLQKGAHSFLEEAASHKKKETKIQQKKPTCQGIFKERFLPTAKPFPHWDLLKYRHFLQRKGKYKACHQSRISSYFILIAFFLQCTPDGKEYHF